MDSHCVIVCLATDVIRVILQAQLACKQLLPAVVMWVRGACFLYGIMNYMARCYQTDQKGQIRVNFMCLEARFEVSLARR